MKTYPRALRLGLLSLGGLLACESGKQVTITPVVPPSLTRRVDHLCVVATLDDARAQPECFKPEAVPFTLRLGSEVRGQLRVEVEAWSKEQPSHLLALGSTSVSVGEADRYQPPAVALAPQRCTGAGFCWENAPPGNVLRAISGSADTDLWAVGELGTVLHYNGSSWAASDAHTTSHLNAVWSRRSDDVWAVGEGGVVLHFDGEQWRSLATGVKPVALYGVGGGASGAVWVAGEEGRVLRYDDLAWSPERYESGGRTLRAVWGTQADEVLVVGDGGTVQVWSGAVPAKQASPVARPAPTAANLNAVWGRGPTEIWLAGDGGAVLRWDGAAYRSIPGAPAVSLRAIRGGAGGSVWLVGDGGTTLRWDGQALRSPSLGAVPQNLLGLWSGATGEPLVVGGWQPNPTTRNGVLLRWGETGWTSPPSIPSDGLAELPRPLFFNKLWRDASGVIFAVGSAGDTEAMPIKSLGIVRRFDGERWSPPTVVPGANVLNAVWGSSPTDVWAAGEPGLFHFDGTAWSASTPLPKRPIMALWGSGAKDVWAAGAGGTMIHWDGTSWTTVSVEATLTSLALWGSGPSDVWAVGERVDQTAMAMRWDGASWQLVTPGTKWPFYAVWGSGPGDVWAAGFAGVVVRWNGQAFVEQTTPNDGSYLLALWGTGPRDVWAAGASDRAFHWDGSGWTGVGTSVFSILRGMTGGGDHLWAVGANGTLLRRALPRP